MDGHPVGAYGLRLTGLDGARDLLLSADTGWPAVQVRWEHSRPHEVRLRIEHDRATIPYVPDGSTLVERRSATVVVRSSRAVPAPELAHPYLSLGGAVIGRWLGRAPFHAGGFVFGGGAWAVPAGSFAGKSTLLAWLSLQGLSIVTDDTLVVERGRCLPGPRCLDLRLEAAAALGLEGETSAVRRGNRRRLLLGAIEPSVPLRGWIFLEWDSAVQVVQVRQAELLVRLAGLSRENPIRRGPGSRLELLDLASLPAFALRRPKSPRLMQESGRELLSALPS